MLTTHAMATLNLWIDNLDWGTVVASKTRGPGFGSVDINSIFEYYFSFKCEEKIEKSLESSSFLRN